jgi:hypothetical protein
LRDIDGSNAGADKGRDMFSLSAFKWGKPRKKATSFAEFVDHWAAHASWRVDCRRNEERTAISVRMFLMPFYNGVPEIQHCREVIGKDFSSAGIWFYCSAVTPATEMLLVIPQIGPPICIRVSQRAATPIGRNYCQIGVKVLEEIRYDSIAELHNLDLAQLATHAEVIALPLVDHSWSYAARSECETL